MLTKKMVKNALLISDWELANKVLYDLCKKKSRHEEYPEILAKVLLIGRSYAAAIERRKAKDVILGQDFYMEKVAPMIWDSPIDTWFDDLRKYRTINDNSISDILDVHLKLTNLFTDISGLKKRSLASKYLHFHFPNLYFIYDSRALKSISKLRKSTDCVEKPKEKTKYSADNEYRKLFEKCMYLKSYILTEYNINVTPRQIDNLLLTMTGNT